MNDELGPAARALLDAAREGLSPDAAAVRRVRARIGVAGGAAGGAAAATTLGVKLAVVALAVAVAAGVGWLAKRSGAAPVVTPKVELASSPEAAVRAAMPEAAAPPLVDDDLITIEAPSAADPPRGAVSMPSRGEPRHTPASPPSNADHAVGRDSAVAATLAPARGGPATAGSAAPGPAAPARATPARAAIDLAREVELLDLAMTALRRGDAGAALQAVQRHAVETGGRGQLAEDAAAIEIEALCHLGDPTAGAKLDAFDARFPRSAQRSRLDNKCSGARPNRAR